jgi:hypothetical protein
MRDRGSGAVQVVDFRLRCPVSGITVYRQVCAMVASRPAIPYQVAGQGKTCSQVDVSHAHAG